MLCDTGFLGPRAGGPLSQRPPQQWLGFSEQNPQALRCQKAPKDLQR